MYKINGVTVYIGWHPPAPNQTNVWRWLSTTQQTICCHTQSVTHVHHVADIRTQWSALPEQYYRRAWRLLILFASLFYHAAYLFESLSLTFVLDRLLSPAAIWILHHPELRHLWLREISRSEKKKDDMFCLFGDHVTLLHRLTIICRFWMKCLCLNGTKDLTLSYTCKLSKF